MTSYSTIVSGYLQREFGPLRHAEKILARMTDATPRTVRAWMAGEHAPYGEHLLSLMAECDGLEQEILKAVRERRCAPQSLSNSVGAEWDSTEG